MNFLNLGLALVLEITKRNENLNILMGSIIIGSFLALLIFGGFLFSFKLLRIPKNRRFKALLFGANMTIVVLLYRWLPPYRLIDWDYYLMIFSALVALNTFIFIFKFKYLDN